MEQHPVPQNISSYQFHLVGDMTLKQFLELAGGVVVAVLFYATGLPGIIKWPLILISVAFGAALAFVPLEERPLEKWIFAFFRSIYSPTLFHWEKIEGVKYFQDEPANGEVAGKIPFANKLDEGESSYLTRLTSIFNPSSTAPVNSQSVVPTPTQPVPVQNISTPQIIPNTSQIAAAEPAMRTSAYMTVDTPLNPVLPVQAPRSADEGRHEVQIPQASFISVGAQQARPQFTVQEVPLSQQEKINLEQRIVEPTLIKHQTPSAVPAQTMFSVNAAPPSLPTIANTVSGQVMDNEMKLVEGAILEVVDPEGRPVRALRTNKAGHFLTVTPLMNGKYKIIVEKEGLNFDPIEFETNGSILEPIAIKAK